MKVSLLGTYFRISHSYGFYFFLSRNTKWQIEEKKHTSQRKAKRISSIKLSPIYRSAYVGRHFSMGLLQAEAVSFSQTVFSRMSLQEIVLEGRDNVSLWSKAQACLLSIINDLGSFRTQKLLTQFLSCNTSYCICEASLDPVHITLWETGG